MDEEQHGGLGKGQEVSGETGGVGQVWTQHGTPDDRNVN